MTTVAAPVTSIKEISEGKRDMYTLNPEKLVIVTDKANPLYDERVTMELDETFVLSIMAHGVLEPVLIRRNGDFFEVVDGRQRVRGAIEANKRLPKNKQVRVPVITRRDDDKESTLIMIVTNEQRQGDSPVVRARKANRALEAGNSKEEVARSFRTSVAGLKNLLAILDTTSDVQAMFDRDQVPVTVASRIARLPREQQGQAMADLIAQGGATKAAVRAKVTTLTEANRTGVPEADVVRPPSKATLRAVADAYPADLTELTGMVDPYKLLKWVLTGTGAAEVTPGPQGKDTLAEWLDAQGD